MTDWIFAIDNFDLEGTIPSYPEASRDPTPTYSLGRANDIPTTIYFCPRPLDLNLQYNMERHLPPSRICHTVIHRGTFHDWETAPTEESVQATLKILYKSLVGYYDDYRLKKIEWDDCQAAIKRTTEDLSCRTFRDESCILKLVDEDTVKHLKEIRKKMSKYGSKGCLVYSKSTSGKDPPGILPFLRRWWSSYSNKANSTISELQAEPQDAEGRGRSLSRVTFYINYTSDLKDVEKTREAMGRLAASLDKRDFAIDKKIMKLMARSKGFAIHNTPGEVLDILSSSERWERNTGRSPEAGTSCESESEVVVTA
ncbi:hypothetical protein I302_100903 [Kwoniella bestiolae CBS 10118]|uniref:Uncharacterized protein n=1 Tax=Kwoniella bestiolae CBS 10118 TaxID=1296100 RepID=A0A1B9G6H1_9TREE|nr:hypothetical protein I302_04278 [Kwoniella bestiolae CBS 10118]OCF26592.1 hypothetical protein I302_04278 [Kwoniella bestiolae CBS 10118]